MVSTTRFMLAMTAVAMGSMLAAKPAQADVLNGWFGPQYVAYRPMFPRRTVVAMAPTTVAFSPVASGCNTCAPTTVGFAPVTSYRPVSVSVPVTTFRPVATCSPCGGVTTVMSPVTMVTQQVQYQPVTSFQPVAAPCGGGCSTCGVQTAAFAAPGCSTCGTASSGCASGNCGTNFGSVSSPGATYAVGPTSSFEPTPAAVPSTTPVSPNYNAPTAAPGYNVPTTAPEPPTPNIAPHSHIPQTQVEPANVAPENSGALKAPSAFHESASQQPLPRLRPVPHTSQESSNAAPEARPQLVDPQDKTARAATSDFQVQQAVYSSPVSITPVNVAPLPTASSQSVLTQGGLSQEEIDAEGWGPAKR